MTTLVVESVLRSLLLAAMVWTGIKLLRVRHVLAQKIAWGLVLLVSFAMPGLMRWQAAHPGAALILPIRRTAAFDILAQRLDRIRLDPIAANPPAATSHRSAAPAGIPTAAMAAPASAVSAPAVSESPVSTPPSWTPTASAAIISPPVISLDPAYPVLVKVWRLSDLLRYLLPTYLVVCALLLLRLAIGLAIAMRIWHTAELASPILEPRATVRISPSIQSPVTIGTGIVLPANYTEWDRAKLRLVLAHERSHVRQGDFYLQLLASLYASLVWFSPLGWWLKRRLADLGEALSDRAAVLEANDRTSYAQVLLEFASMPRHGFAGVTAGVGMARSSNIQSRIERILNERSFRLSFSAGRRHAVLAALLVPCGLVLATSLLHVQAAETVKAQAIAALQTTQNQDVAPEATAPAPPVPAAAPAAAAPPSPPVVLSPVQPSPAPPAPARPANLSPLFLQAGPEAVAPLAPLPPAAFPVVPPLVPVAVSLASMPMVLLQDDQAAPDHTVIDSHSDADGHHSFSILHLDSGDNSYAIVAGKANVVGSGTFGDAFDRARRQAKGDFIWFERGGKSYVITDPALVAQGRELFRGDETWVIRKQVMDKLQYEIHENMAVNVHPMVEVKIQPIDLSKEIAELQKSLATLQNLKPDQISQEALANAQREVAKVQGGLIQLQMKTSIEQSQAIGEQMKNEFAQRREEFERQRADMKREQADRTREATQRVQSLIDQALRDGKARPVD